MQVARVILCGQRQWFQRTQVFTVFGLHTTDLFNLTLPPFLLHRLDAYQVGLLDQLKLPAVGVRQFLSKLLRISTGEQKKVKQTADIPLI